MQHLAVRLLFVAVFGEISEEFISFIKMERFLAVDIEQAINGHLTHGLSLNDLSGQGYDGWGKVRCSEENSR